MSTTQVRDRLAVAASRHETVTATLRNGNTLVGVPTGAGRPRWFRIGDTLVHQYNIVNLA